MRSNFTKILFVALFFFSSCTPYKNIPYFQDLDHSKITEQPITNYTPIKIQPGDLLGLNVTSQSPPEANAVFNSSLNRVTGTDDNTGGNKLGGGVGSENAGSNPIFGYRVNDKGEIELPDIGVINVAGFTTDELAAKLTPQLAQYLAKPIVNVRLLNFKISVSGDVLRPDVFTIQSERITIIEALSLAGDLNITAKRKSVLLIRESDGKRQFIPIDLTSKKLFDSPYYYLRNNDAIYVDPDRTKYAPLDRGYRTLTLVFSAISAASVIITAVVLFNQNQ
jgi:polysaccharide export outer membrane protein